MKFHIEFEVFESVIDDAMIMATRAIGAPIFEGLLKDPRVESSGHYIGRRSGYIVMEAGSAEEIMMLVGPMLDRARFRIDPVIGFEAVLHKFSEDAKH